MKFGYRSVLPFLRRAFRLLFLSVVLLAASGRALPLAGDAAGSLSSAERTDSPLAGTYTVGGSGADFATPAAAVLALTSLGVEAAVTLKIAPGTYTGTLTLTAIPGVSEAHPVVFRRDSSVSGTVMLQASAADSTVLLFAGARYVSFDGVDLAGSGAALRHTVCLSAASDHITLCNAVFSGPGASVLGTDVVFVQGAGGSDHHFDRLTLRQAERGIRLEGGATLAAAGNAVTHCRIDSVRCGVMLTRQKNALVQGNDIVLSAAQSDEADAIRVMTTLPGDTLWLDGNRLHGIRTAAVYAVGIRVKTDSAAAVVRISNNMLYDFQATGSAQVRALYISSGRTEILNNSVLVSDVAASGATYGLYLGTLPSMGSALLRNNIFVNREATTLAYNIFALTASTIFSSDYNIFHGTGGSYRLGRFGGDQATLAAWSAATGGDAHSQSGDPLFRSATDLHLAPHSSIAHQNGALTPALATDIDGELRIRPPDRGADEYEYRAPAADFAVLGFADPDTRYVEWSPENVSAIVFNRGSEEQIDVPLALYFNGEQIGETIFSLPPLQCDTVLLPWETLAAPASGTLLARCFLPGDVDPSNDSASQAVEVVGAPLAGNLAIGSGGDYATFNAALADLARRGVTSPVVIDIAPGVYNEQLTVPYIPGASATDTVCFRPASGSVTLHAAGGPSTLLFSGARHVHFHGIHLSAAAPNYVAVQFESGADSNEVASATLSGPSLIVSTACGIRSQGGGCDGNVLRELAIDGFYYGIRLEGTSARPDAGNRVEQCVIGSSRIALRTDYQAATLLRNNIIHTGYSAATATTYGLWLGTQSANCEVVADGNVLTGGQGATGACAIYSNTAQGTALIANHQIGGWAVTGSAPLYGILVGGGSATVAFNSLWMNDVATSGDVIAIADTGAATALSVTNNVVQSSERANRVLAFWHGGGLWTSDYNACYNRAADNPRFVFGRASSADALSLSDWQSATGHDAHSLWGDPGFLDSLNLHIAPNASLLDSAGQSLAAVSADADGELRANPPDIGADEYLFLETPDDFAVRWLTPPGGSYPSGAPTAFELIVTNYGWLGHSDVPVQLSFEGTVAGEQFIGLAPGASDTLTLTWIPPDLALTEGRLVARVALPGDWVAANDSASAVVTVIGAPLAGEYDVAGGAAAFPSLSEAVRHLARRGVNGPVTLNLYDADAAGTLSLGEIPGADSTAPVLIRTSANRTQPVTLSADLGEAVLLLDGADNLIFENLCLAAAGSCTTAVTLRGGACGNRFRHCAIRGADSLASATTAIRVLADGNHGNQFDSLTVTGAFTGIALGSGLASGQSDGNRVCGCLLQGARYGISVCRQNAALLAGNDIQPGSAATLAAACYGVFINALGTGGSVTVNANRIHGFTDGSGALSNRAVGIYAAAGGDATVLAFNNVIYDFSAAGSLKRNGFYLSAGTNRIYHNSVRLDNAATSAEIAAVYVSTGSDHQLRNNLFVGAGDDLPAYSLLIAAGQVNSDGNAFFGPANFSVARLGTMTYTTLSAWQGTGNDAHSLVADPGFVSPSDLHLADSSSAVRRHGLATTVTTDLDGDSRSTRPDIGADEFTASTVPPAILDLTLYPSDGAVLLAWSAVPFAACYHIYRDSTLDVAPDPAFLLATVPGTSFADPIPPDEWSRFFYIVVADPTMPGGSFGGPFKQPSPQGIAEEIV